MAAVGPQWIREAEVAEMLDVPKRTLQGWRYRRIGPPYARLNGSTVRYDRDAVVAWMRAQAV